MPTRITATQWTTGYKPTNDSITDLPNTLPGPKPIGGPGQEFPPLDPHHFVPVTPEQTRPPSTLINRYTPKPPPQIRANLAGANTPIPIVYGTTRVVCKPLIIRQADTGNAAWLMLYGVSCGEIEGFKNLIIDGRNLDVSAKTPGTAFASNHLFGFGEGVLYTGTAAQNVSTWLSTYYTGYTDALPDIAFVAFRMQARLVTGSIPRVETIIDGVKNLYDPRALTTGFSTNPALIISHFIANEIGGTVNEQSVIDHANVCDEVVGSGVRREMSHVMDSPLENEKQLVLMANTAGCFIWQEGGEYFLISDRPATASGDINNTMRIKGKAKAKKSGQYKKPDDVNVVWYDFIGNNIHDAFTGGPQTAGKLSVIKMPGINNYAQARREAIERHNKATLEDLEVTDQLHSEGLRLRIGDVKNYYNSELGISNKPVRVLGLSMPEPGLWDVVLREYQAAVYSDNIDADPITPDTNLPDPYSPPPLDFDSASVNSISENGQVLCEVDPVDYDYLFQNLVEIQTLDSGNDVLDEMLIPSSFFDGTVKKIAISGGATMQMRNVSLSGAVSAWTSQSIAYAADYDPGTVPAVVGFAGVDLGGEFSLTWGLGTYKRYDYFKILTNETGVGRSTIVVPGSDTSVIIIGSVQIQFEITPYSTNGTAGTSSQLLFT